MHPIIQTEPNSFKYYQMSLAARSQKSAVRETRNDVPTPLQEVASRYGTVLCDRFGSCGAFALRTCGTVGKKSEKPEEDRASLSQIVALPQSIYERPGSSEWRVANTMNVIFSSNTWSSQTCESHKVNLSREATVLSGHITN